MDIKEINTGGLVLLGCGKMGSALLAGWLRAGVDASSVWVIDPFPSDWLTASGVHINEGMPPKPTVLVVAVKPQMMTEALPNVAALGGGNTLILSVAAGTPIAFFEDILGDGTPIVRTMPNTPAAIGQGISALVGNDHVSAAQLKGAETLMRAVGQTVQLENEEQMDAVTAVSGSGPAYVFHMIECLAAAGVSQGLSSELSMELAKATVAGAGALAQQAEETPDQLRVNVTSPKGTTEAGLAKLMDAKNGLPGLMKETVAAAADRSRELGK